MDFSKEKNWLEIQQSFEKIPPVNEITNRTLQSMPLNSLLLLDWLICGKEFEIKEIKFEEYIKSQKRLKFNSKPSHVFEISYKVSSEKNQIFDDLSKEHSVEYGFHGSPLENWFSILHNGLKNKFQSDRSLYGQGIYLALDNSVAENFFTLGNNWKHSAFKAKVGCVAGCEVAKNPNEVQLVGESKNYLVVSNESLVRIKNLLVFEGEPKRTSNKCGMILVAYLLLLFFVAFMRTSYWKKLIGGPTVANRPLLL